ncbi:MAG: hypothetical protein MI919_18135, partial [Holophagales bacterium]|nr:hypothetical protein [Holophagales bacterium]
WGACMLYRVARPPGGTGPEARHLELIQDKSAPLVKGNHLFCSISGELDDHPSSGVAGRRAPEGHRTMTVSTHLSAAELASTPPGDRAALIDGIHRRMREGLDHLAPEWRDVRFEATASPRTFERFTARHGGLVGGIPRRVGWRSYLDLFSPPPSPPRIHPVGDSVFPGQSTLAVALGGVRLARRLAEGWGFGPGSMGVRPVAGAGSEPAAEWLTAGVGKRFE